MKLVILDRDGTINVDSDQYIKSPDEWRPIPGSLEAIARLTQAGYRLVVATNQSGIARGLFDVATLNAIHDSMHSAVAQAGGRIEAVFFCPHAADSDCACRKPKPGMLEAAIADHDLDPSRCFMIGDKLADVQAGQRAKMRGVLVRTGYGAEHARETGEVEPDFVAGDVHDAVMNFILPAEGA